MNFLKNLFTGKDVNEKEVSIDVSEFKQLSKSGFSTFSDLLEQHGALSFEKQLILGDIVGANSWQFDMDKGQVSFGANHVFPVQIIGSISFGDNSWMWGWANTQSGIPEHLLVQSNALKQIGEQYGIDEFNNPHFLVDGRFDHQVGLIASGLFKSKCYYSANYSKGSLVFTIDTDKIPEPSADLIKVISTFNQFITQIEISHKEAFKNYLIDKGFLLKIDNNTISGLKDNTVIRAEFDSLGRLINLKNIC